MERFVHSEGSLPFSLHIKTECIAAAVEFASYEQNDFQQYDTYFFVSSTTYIICCWPRNYLYFSNTAIVYSSYSSSNNNK